MFPRITLVAAVLLIPGSGQDEPRAQPVQAKPLVPPTLLQKEALEAGNPLATYAAMLDLEPQYRASEVFAGFYAESRHPDYQAGFYLRAPVFAAAVRTARRLGYRLVAYDTAERGPAGDASFRDRTQAANLKSRVFDRDPRAKVLVIAGRLHASKIRAPDGWTPMGFELQRLTGIDPFAVYAPTMSQRLTPDEENPWYRF